MYADLPLDKNGHLLQEEPRVPARVKALIWAEWYEDAEGYLYIVDTTSDEWVYGPDCEISDRIADELDCGTSAWELAEVIEELAYVDYIFRRFSPEDGFFHA